MVCNSVAVLGWRVASLLQEPALSLQNARP
jgi:hypothetical protein